MTSEGILLSAGLTILQVLLCILIAPLLRGFCDFLSARIVGTGAPPVLRRWFMIAERWAGPSDNSSDLLSRQNLRVADFSASTALICALIVTTLVPPGTVKLLTNSGSDFFIIILLLAAGRIFAVVPALNVPGTQARQAMNSCVRTVVVLPPLFLIAALIFPTGATTTFSQALSAVYQAHGTGDSAVFVLAALSLFVAFPGADDKLFTNLTGMNWSLAALAQDMMFLTGLLLTADFMFPALFPWLAGQNSLWMISGSFVLSVLCVFVLAALVVCGRLVVMTPVMGVRLRAAAALILTLFAIQTLTGAHLSFSLSSSDVQSVP